MPRPQRNAAIAIFEGLAAALHHLTNGVSHLLFLQTAFALLLRFPTTRCQGYHQFGVTVDDDIRIVPTMTCRRRLTSRNWVTIKS